MPASPTYTPILPAEVDADSPLTAALAFRWTFNAISIMEGSPTARAEGMGVWIEKSPSGAPYPAVDRQTGILTDATDPSLVLTPDGLGSVQWSAKTYFTAYNASLQANSLGTSQNASLAAEAGSGWGGIGSSTPEIVGGRKLVQGANPSRVVLSCFVSKAFTVPGTQNPYGETTNYTWEVRLYRKRGGSYTLLRSFSQSGTLSLVESPLTHTLSAPLDTIVFDAMTNDSYHIESSYIFGSLQAVAAAIDNLKIFSAN
jgi:hypothetical protein